MLITGKRLGSKLLLKDLALDITMSNDVKLDKVASYKLLGVSFDQNLTFDEHIGTVCKKLTQRIGKLRSIKYSLPKQERILLYNAVIKPVLMYGSDVWTKTSHDNLNRVFRLQKRPPRVILNVGVREERTVTLFDKLNWIRFYDETKIDKCCVVYKCLQGSAPDYLINRITKISNVSFRTTRFSDINLRCPRYIRETVEEKTFLTSASKWWNTLPIFLRKSASCRVFKKDYFKYLKSQYIWS